MDVKFKELCLPSALLGERYLIRQTTPATWAKTASARRLSCCPCRCSGRPSSSLSPSRRCWWWRHCKWTQTREAVRRQTSDCGSRKQTHWFAHRLPVDGCVADAGDGGKDPRTVDLLFGLLAVGGTLHYEFREVDLSCSDITLDGWDDCRGGRSTSKRVWGWFNCVYKRFNIWLIVLNSLLICQSFDKAVKTAA